MVRRHSGRDGCFPVARLRGLPEALERADPGLVACALSNAPRETARPPGAIYNDLLEALPRLPEVFDKRDIVRALGYKPPYTTLVRALEYLKESGEIADDQRFGYRRSFRKVAREDPERT